MTPFDLTTALRQQTKALHRAVKALPVPRRVMSPRVTKGDYARYIAAVYRVYALMESALLDHVPPHLLAALGVQPKLPALAADLAELEAPSPQPLGRAATALRLPPPGNLAGSVGALYVLERAAFGGRLMARHLRRHLPAEDSALPLRFLEFHGGEAVGAWRRFAKALETLKARPDFHVGHLVEGAQIACESVLGILRLDDQAARQGILSAAGCTRA